MIIQIIKKLLTIFIVFSLSLVQVIGYAFDNLVVSYNSNTSSNTYLIHLQKHDHQKITSQTKKYNFSDGSYTTVSIKWLNITKNKLDFLTNYQGIISYVYDQVFDISIKTSKKSSLPVREYLITSSNNSKFKDKEKIIKQEDKVIVCVDLIVKKYIQWKQFIFSNTPKLPYGLRAPPYIISVTMI